jgi:hypothetical protein
MIPDDDQHELRPVESDSLPSEVFGEHFGYGRLCRVGLPLQATRR